MPEACVQHSPSLLRVRKQCQCYPLPSWLGANTCTAICETSFIGCNWQGRFTTTPVRARVGSFTNACGLFTSSRVVIATTVLGATDRAPFAREGTRKSVKAAPMTAVHNSTTVDCMLQQGGIKVKEQIQQHRKQTAQLEVAMPF